MLAGLASALARPSLAAPRANARIGYLEQVKAVDGELLYREFVEGLQAKGYVEGRNLRMVRRSADLQIERLRAHAVDLVAAKVDAILATTTEAAKAAKLAAPAIPTVFVVSGDPVLEGLVKSISRPGGPLTGLGHARRGPYREAAAAPEGGVPARAQRRDRRLHRQHGEGRVRRRREPARPCRAGVPGAPARRLPRCRRSDLAQPRRRGAGRRGRGCRGQPSMRSRG